MQFLETIISGLSLGSIYAIIALGYTMVYGIAKMLNFAHGDVIMIGAFASYLMCGNYNQSGMVATLVAIVVCTILGVLIERLAYKPLREAPSLAVLITAIGVSYFLQNMAQLIWGSAPKFYTSVVGDGQIKLGALKISSVSLITLLSCVVIMIVLTLFINKTKIGKAMRACSEDKQAAQLMGISVDNTISITFAIGSGLAAIAAVLLCSAYPTVYPTLGAMPGIKAFTAAVFGGIGSIPGAFIGGLMLGLLEIFSRVYISTQLSDAIVFFTLIVILLIRPTGLLGKKISVKV